MGYLTDNTPPGKNYVICQDLYPYRIVINPGEKSNLTLQTIVRDELPDVEEWQFSGRRRCPVAPSRGKSKGVYGRQIVPYGWALDSRRMRPFVEEVVFAFHTELQRSKVTARLTAERFKFRLQNEPGY